MCTLYLRTCQCKLTIFSVVSGHMWLVATMLDRRIWALELELEVQEYPP